MIRFRIKELVAEKSFRERRKITMSEVSMATGVNRSSLSKMSNPEVAHSTTTAAIDSLCKYFDCRVEDVMEYVPEEK
ncbi:helix-turn-helix domain-containing protein [Grimontia marina]|uniref:HTH cro/C1-type domain-containing protein n=1 Tax=Grimontia marina TaxID=646534 RepID=A0A128FJ76_9GAMM|nr:helix-turn-helix transcriptional regulator [Grimontia marina]CZF86620.1 hypothetical protein GMA8713_04654 [Grimontia marina]